jgi:hypothetical protein
MVLIIYFVMSCTSIFYCINMYLFFMSPLRNSAIYIKKCTNVIIAYKYVVLYLHDGHWLKCRRLGATHELPNASPCC